LNYNDYSFEELIDVFIQIDDRTYADRALVILENIAKRLSTSATNIQMEQIVTFPTESSMNLHSMFISSNYFNDVYTDEGVEVRDKLIRLKASLSKS